jgi:hypothetical protein
MAFPISDCPVSVQIWVDIDSADESGDGVYLVDNRVGLGSASEGTTALNTHSGMNQKVCWEIKPVDPNAGAMLAIQSIGNSNAWGPSGQPSRVTEGPGRGVAFTGQMQNPGAATYPLVITVAQGGVSGKTIRLNPNVTVAAL